MVTGAPTGGNRTCLGDAAGFHTALSPKWQGSIRGSYNVPLGDDRSLNFNLLYTYSSSYFFESDERLRQKSYGRVNASAEFWINRNMGVELWVENLTNDFSYQRMLASGVSDAGSPMAPRMYGAKVKFAF